MIYNHIIGIDPDTGKSGVAFLNTRFKNLSIVSLTFFELYDYFLDCKKNYHNDFIVIIEGGWLVEKSNFHAAYGNRAHRVAKNVGSNHETGRKIVEMCQYLGIDHQVVHPLRKIWKGSQGKITHDELAYFTGITQSTCQDQRDAALIAWEYAGLPIRIMPMKTQARKPVLRDLK
jgi:hypothetical protein